MVNRRVLLSAIFVIFTLGSAAFLVSSTLNYMEFYTALDRFYVKLQSVNPVIGETSIQVNVNFSMLNPTSYVGLKLREVAYILRFQANNMSIDLASSIVSYAENPITIDPYWNKTFEYKINLDLTKPETANTRFIELYKSYQGKEVTWTFISSEILLTFASTQYIPSSSSLQTRL